VVSTSAEVIAASSCLHRFPFVVLITLSFRMVVSGPFIAVLADRVTGGPTESPGGGRGLREGNSRDLARQNGRCIRNCALTAFKNGLGDITTARVNCPPQAVS